MDFLRDENTYDQSVSLGLHCHLFKTLHGFWPVFVVANEGYGAARGTKLMITPKFYVDILSQQDPALTKYHAAAAAWKPLPFRSDQYPDIVYLSEADWAPMAVLETHETGIRLIKADILYENSIASILGWLQDSVDQYFDLRSMRALQARAETQFANVNAIVIAWQCELEKAKANLPYVDTRLELFEKVIVPAQRSKYLARAKLARDGKMYSECLSRLPKRQSGTVTAVEHEAFNVEIVHTFFDTSTYHSFGFFGKRESFSAHNKQVTERYNLINDHGRFAGISGLFKKRGKEPELSAIMQAFNGTSNVSCVPERPHRGPLVSRREPYPVEESSADASPPSYKDIKTPVPQSSASASRLSQGDMKKPVPQPAAETSWPDEKKRALN